MLNKTLVLNDVFCRVNSLVLTNMVNDNLRYIRIKRVKTKHNATNIYIYIQVWCQTFVAIVTCINLFRYMYLLSKAID